MLLLSIEVGMGGGLAGQNLEKFFASIFYFKNKLEIKGSYHDDT